jgi:hypothetical protein
MAQAWLRDYVAAGNKFGPRASERDLGRPTGERYDAETCNSDGEDKPCGSGRIGSSRGPFLARIARLVSWKH